MAIILDDSRYSRGTGIFSIYDGVALPSDPGKRALALMDLGTQTLVDNGFTLLGFVPYPGLGPGVGDDVLRYSWILSESHRVLIYDPGTRRLIDELYTCSPEKDGRVMTERTRARLGPPVQTRRTEEIVAQDLALREEPESLFHLIRDAGLKLGLGAGRNFCVSSVFFGMPEGKLEEDTLEVMLTRALNKGDQKPVIEAACRYDPQGYTYLHQSPKHFAGLHSYPGTLKSAHLSLIGSGDAFLSVLLDMEEVIYKRRKTEPTLSLKVVAEGF
jgi:hypothetical protein